MLKTAFILAAILVSVSQTNPTPEPEPEPEVVSIEQTGGNIDPNPTDPEKAKNPQQRLQTWIIEYNATHKKINEGEVTIEALKAKKVLARKALAGLISEIQKQTKKAKRYLKAIEAEILKFEAEAEALELLIKIAKDIIDKDNENIPLDK